MIKDSTINYADQEFANLLSIFITVDGIDINEIYCNDSPFLYLIVNDKLIDLFNIALSLPNVNPNVFNYTTRQTPLMKAIQTNQMKIVLALLSHKNIDINYESINHMTALSMAISSKNIDIIKLLIQNEKLEMNLNYSECLNSAISSDFEECANLLLSKDKSNVNSVIPNLNKIKYEVPFNENIVNNYIKLNFDILEYESIPHSSSILQTAAHKGNTNIVKAIINHPNFIAEQSSLELALIDSVKSNNMEIFEILKNEYLKISKTDVDLLNLLDLNNNSLIVISSASNNIEFMRSIQKTNIKSTSTLYNNQLAFIVAPTNEMMQLIIETLPGVDLNFPMEDGSNYMTALIDFYYSPCQYAKNFDMKNKDNSYSNRNKKLYYLRERIVIDKLKFILSNSNLKLTSKDMNGYSFISKVSCRIYCANYSTLTMLMYTIFGKEVDKQIDEKTKKTQLHFIAENIPNVSFISSIQITDSSLTKYDYEDDFDLLVNQFFLDKKCCIFFDIYSDELKQHKNIFEAHLNSVDSLKQTPLIKSVLNLNLYFADFLLSDCDADIEVIDVFGNTVLDYLLMLSDMVYSYPNLNRIKKDWNAEKNEINNKELCNLIIKDMIKFLVGFDNEFVCMIIIKLSIYSIAPTS